MMVGGNAAKCCTEKHIEKGVSDSSVMQDVMQYVMLEIMLQVFAERQRQVTIPGWKCRVVSHSFGKMRDVKCIYNLAWGYCSMII